MTVVNMEYVCDLTKNKEKQSTTTRRFCRFCLWGKRKRKNDGLITGKKSLLYSIKSSQNRLDNLEQIKRKSIYYTFVNGLEIEMARPGRAYNNSTISSSLEDRNILVC